MRDSRQVRDLLQASFEELKGALEDPIGVWEFQKNHNGVQVYTHSDPTYTITAKGHSELNFRIESVREAFSSTHLQLQWDETLASVNHLLYPKELAPLDTKAEFQLVKLRTMWPVTPRELCVVRTEKHIDGNIWIWATSTYHSEAETTSSGFIRANLRYLGVCIEPLENKCRVSLAIKLAPAGSLSSFAARRLSSLYPHILSDLHKFLLKTANPTVTPNDHENGQLRSVNWTLPSHFPVLAVLFMLLLFWGKFVVALGTGVCLLTMPASLKSVISSIVTAVTSIVWQYLSTSSARDITLVVCSWGAVLWWLLP